MWLLQVKADDDRLRRLMRAFLRTIGTRLLMLAGLGVGAAMAQLPAPTTTPAPAPTTTPTTGPTTTPTSRNIETVSPKSLVQLRIRDGLLELYTDHPATKGLIPVRVGEGAVSAQLRIVSSSEQLPPYRPDAFDLTIDQVGSTGIIHTTVSSVGANVQVWRDVTLPDQQVAVVQLVQPGMPDADGGAIRLYIQRMIGEDETGKANFPASGFSTLIRQHLEPTDEYLRPIFQSLGGQEQLFDVEPALAAEVFADRMRPDAELQKTVAALVAKLDADRPQDRNAAQAELEELGEAAAVALRSVDASKLSLEQQTRIRTILSPQTHAAGIDPAKLRGNVPFLLDALNCRDPGARHAALEELRAQTHQAIPLDLDGPEDVRREKVRELRSTLTAPTTAPATMPATQAAEGPER